MQSRRYAFFKCVCPFSPQDTVIALQALAYYAAISGANAINLRLSISDPASTYSVFYINSSNFLAYQRREVRPQLKCKGAKVKLR